MGSRGDDVKDLRTAINSLGILLTIIGVVMVYRYSPLNESVVDGGGADTDFGAIERKQKCRNQLLKLGVYLVLGGSFVQLVSNFLPSGSSAAA